MYLRQYLINDMEIYGDKTMLVNRITGHGEDSGRLSVVVGALVILLVAQIKVGVILPAIGCRLRISEKLSTVAEIRHDACIYRFYTYPVLAFSI